MLQRLPDVIQRYARACFLLCVTSLVSVPAFASHEALLLPKGEKKSVVIGYWQKVLQDYAKGKQWRMLGHMTKTALTEISQRDLQKIANGSDCHEFKNAVKASMKMQAFAKEAKVSFADLVQMALFIEAEIDTVAAKKGNYISRAVTGFARSIEIDPETRRSFIHLRSRGIKILGKGYKKIVTKSIMYDAKKPQIVAHCTSIAPMQDEMKALETVHGMPGVLKVHAYTTRINNEGVTQYTILCKYYKGGSLAEVLKESHKRRLSLRHRMHIAHDIINGLASIHSKNLAHRDVNLKNCFVEKARHGKIKRHKAVVADFGRAMPLHLLVGKEAQGNPYYIPPEGIHHHTLTGKDYQQADIYAAGCICYRLLTGRRPPWINKDYVRDITRSPVVRKQMFVHKLNEFRKKRFAYWISKNPNREKKYKKERFERIFLRMIDPNPARRGSATHLRELMKYLVKDTFRKHKKRK